MVRCTSSPRIVSYVHPSGKHRDPEPVPQYRRNSMDDATWLSRIRDQPQSKQLTPVLPCALLWCYVLDLYLAHPTQGHHGALAALPLLVTEDMVSRLSDPCPSWPTLKVTLSKVPVQAKRGSSVDLISACLQQLICLLTTSNTTAIRDVFQNYLRLPSGRPQVASGSK